MVSKNHIIENHTESSIISKSKKNTSRYWSKLVGPKNG